MKKQRYRLWLLRSPMWTLAGLAVLVAACGGSEATFPAGAGGDAGVDVHPETSATDGCTPVTCAAVGAECGSISDGCGGTLACGECAQGTCGGGGPNRCGTGCVATSCAAEGAVCGVISDGCSGTLSCGTCPDFQVCDVSAGNVCVCAPTNCIAAGAACGVIQDGCGGVLSCGDCTPPDICGAGGVPNQCGCVPVTCAGVGAHCGILPDGCGGTIQCGVCPPPQTCGGGGVPNLCGTGSCTPTTCAAQGAECGIISDQCGNVLDCGSCPVPETCGGGGVANRCGCAPTSCTQQNAECGTIPDGCGGALDCGSCPLPETCGGSGLPNQCGCTPTTCTAASAQCGTILDGCGGTLDCGSCPPPETCGGSGLPNQCGCTPTTCAVLGLTCGTAPDGCGGTLDCGPCILFDVEPVDHPLDHSVSLVSIDVDSANRPHIAYLDTTNRRVRYVYHDGTGWQNLDVGASLAIWGGASIDIQVDSSDHVHFVHVDPSYNLIHTVHDQTAFAVETFGGSGQAVHMRMAVDATDGLHVVTANSASVGYYTNASGSWVSSVVADAVAYDSADISIGPQGRIGVCWFDRDTDTYRYSLKGGLPPWPAEHVSGPKIYYQEYSYDCAVDFDTAQGPHILYLSPTGGGGRYYYHHASKPTGSWLNSSFSPLLSTYQDSELNLVIDDMDQTHAVYRDLSGDPDTIVYGVEGPTDFQPVVVDSGAINWHSGLALDADGLAHIAYSVRESTYHQVKYAVQSP